MICYASSAGLKHLSAVDANGIIRAKQTSVEPTRYLQMAAKPCEKLPPLPAMIAAYEARRFVRVLAAVILVAAACALPGGLRAQTAADTTAAPSLIASAVVPQQVRFEGKLAGRSSESVEVVFRIYAAPEGTEPLWTETQQVGVAADGSYSVLLGAATTAGLPQAVFAGGQARWLGVTVERGEEQERVLLSSVPYAMKSADAESLAGHAAAEFATRDQFTSLASKLNAVERAAAAPAFSAQPETTTPTGAGVANTVPLWTSSSTLGNSVITQSGGKIGINFAAPAATLEVGGPMTVHGTLDFPPGQPATSTSSSQSQSFNFSASAWNSSTAAPVSSTYTMLAGPTGNNTAAPGSIFYFNYQNGTGSAVNLFTLNGKGLMQLPNATGGILSNGNIALTPSTVATSTSATNSPLLEIGASSFSSASDIAHAQTFAWQAQGTANDTASPSGSLALLYGSNGATPAATGLAIAPNGQITFASGQQFPVTGTGGGTISAITTASPLTGSGTSGSVALGLNETQLTTDITPALRTTFNSIYPLLNGGNTLTGNQTINGSLTETVGAYEGLGPILALTNPSGGQDAEAAVDFRTYLHSDSAATPTARIVAVDDNNYGNGLYFESKTDGADSNGLQVNVVIPSLGGLIAYGHTNDGYGGIAFQAISDAAYNGADAQNGANFTAGNTTGGTGTGGSGIYAHGGTSDGGPGGDGGDFYGGATSAPYTEHLTSGGYGGSFTGGNGIFPGDGLLGIPGSATSGSETGRAGTFAGDVAIYGDLYATHTDFPDDDPIDPANKYLSHTAVASSEQMNIYSGNVTTDQYGNAVVTLPEWFEAVNTDFRYQLTVIGRFAQAIVAKEIENNQFTISTNATFVKVSWLVTGVRNDAYSKAHPLVVRQDKPAIERGYYLHPELYGQPEEKQIEWARHPQKMKALKQQREHPAPHPQPVLPAKAKAAR